MRFRWRCTAGILISSLLLGSVFAQESRRPEAARLMNELMSGSSGIGIPFSLPDAEGHIRQLSDFRGKLVLLYFGYTFCPDVCPTDLAILAELLQRLGRDAEQVQVLFVTLDPARDTPRVLRTYVPAFDPRFIALRGSPAQTRRIATAYKTYYEKVSYAGNGAYLVDHTAFVYLLGRDGRYQAFFPPGTPSERMELMVRESIAAP